VDILSKHSGVITKFYAEEGDNVEVGAEFVEIDTEAKAGAAPPKKEEAAAPKQEATPAAEAPKATPAAPAPAAPTQAAPTATSQKPKST